MSLMVLSIGNEGVSTSTVGKRKVSTSGHIKQSKKIVHPKMELFTIWIGHQS